jgi:hypothetical protein
MMWPPTPGSNDPYQGQEWTFGSPVDLVEGLALWKSFETPREGARSLIFESHGQLQRLVNSVEQLRKVVCVPNWDGEGAEAVHPDTVDVARELAMQLPIGIGTPEVHASAFGEINFDWTIARDKRFTVGVGSPPRHDLAFALLFGYARLNGREPWNGRLPTVIGCCLERLNQ